MFQKMIFHSDSKQLTRCCVNCNEVKFLNASNFPIENKSKHSKFCRSCLNLKNRLRYQETKHNRKEKKPVRYVFKEYASEYVNLNSEPVVYFEGEEDILNQINELEKIKKLKIDEISIEEIEKINQDYENYCNE